MYFNVSSIFWRLFYIKLCVLVFPLRSPSICPGSLSTEPLKVCSTISSSPYLCVVPFLRFSSPPRTLFMSFALYMQCLSSPAGHFGCLIKLAPWRQLKNLLVVPLPPGQTLCMPMILTYLYMCVYVCISHFPPFLFILFLHDCNFIVKVVQVVSADQL